MIRRLLPLVILGLFSGCCCCKSENCRLCKPPVNCLGNCYDGASSGCYRPPGPFWCCLPGPCSTCRDPWLQYYQECNAGWIKRPVVGVDAGGHAVDDEDGEYMTTTSESAAPRVIHQAKAEE